MTLDECIDVLSRETLGYVLLAVDRKGDIVSSASEFPLAQAMVTAQAKANTYPNNFLSTTQIIENLISLGKLSPDSRTARSTKIQAKSETSNHS